MAERAGHSAPSRRFLATRALGVVAPWFLFPVAWLIWMLTGHTPQLAGGFTPVAVVFGYIAWAVLVGLTLLATAWVLLVVSSAGRLHRARRPVLAVGLISSVPAAVLAVLSLMAIIQ